MNEQKIAYAVVCGPMESLESYTKADKRFIPGYQDSEDTLISITKFEEHIKTADLGVEMWLHPMTKDFAVKFLKSAKEYGFLNRVMFGSDQMVWPEAITSSITF